MIAASKELQEATFYLTEAAKKCYGLIDKAKMIERANQHQNEAIRLLQKS